MGAGMHLRPHDARFTSLRVIGRERVENSTEAQAKDSVGVSVDVVYTNIIEVIRSMTFATRSKKNILESGK